MSILHFILWSRAWLCIFLLLLVKGRFIKSLEWASQQSNNWDLFSYGLPIPHWVLVAMMLCFWKKLTINLSCSSGHLHNYFGCRFSRLYPIFVTSGLWLSSIQSCTIYQSYLFHHEYQVFLGRDLILLVILMWTVNHILRA